MVPRRFASREEDCLDRAGGVVTVGPDQALLPPRYGDRRLIVSKAMFPARHRSTNLEVKAMSEEKLRQQLYDAFATRAHIYHLLFQQLRLALGPERAAELMGRAIYQRGVQNAVKYAAFAPGTWRDSSKPS